MRLRPNKENPIHKLCCSVSWTLILNIINKSMWAFLMWEHSGAKTSVSESSRNILRQLKMLKMLFDSAPCCFFQKADINWKHLELSSRWWSCQSLTQYTTPQRSVQSPAPSPKRPPPLLALLSSLLTPSFPTERIAPSRLCERLPRPDRNHRGQSSSGSCSETPLRRSHVSPRMTPPPPDKDRGGSQRSKVQPGPSRVLQTALHRLRLWGLGAKS